MITLIHNGHNLGDIISLNVDNIWDGKRIFMNISTDENINIEREVDLYSPSSLDNSYLLESKVEKLYKEGIDATLHMIEIKDLVRFKLRYANKEVIYNINILR